MASPKMNEESAPAVLGEGSVRMRRLMYGSVLSMME